MIYVGRVRVSVFRMFIFCFYYVCICACVYASVQLIPLFYAAIYNCACLFSIQFMWVFFFFFWNHNSSFSKFERERPYYDCRCYKKSWIHRPKERHWSNKRGEKYNEKKICFIVLKVLRTNRNSEEEAIWLPIGELLHVIDATVLFCLPTKTWAS